MPSGGEFSSDGFSRRKKKQTTFSCFSSQMSFLACCALQGLCSGASCVVGCCGKTAALHHGVRAVYFVFFLLTAILAWVASSFGQDLLQKYSCCRDFLSLLSAYNITFAFVVFHFLLGLVVVGVKDAHSTRGALHNGWWGPKFLLWIGMLVGFLWLPIGFWHVYPWISFVGSVLFTVIQLFMLVDFAHTWNESWVDKYHETQNKNWFRLLLSVTIALLLAVLVGTALMYAFLRSGDCQYNALNIGLISANLGLVVLCCALSVLPSIQERNPRASLLTASVVGVYATYLVSSAIFSEPMPPAASAECSFLGNPNDATVLRYVTLIMGALITFVAVAFSSMRAGSHAGSAPSSTTEQSPLVVNRDASSSDEEKGKGGEQDIEVQKQRALEKSDRELLNLDDRMSPHDGASEAVAYNYTWFHVVMLLGSMYIGCLLTNWAFQTGDIGIPTHGVDKSMVAVYMKAASSWVVCLLYIWTLVAPIVLPNRDFGH